MPPQSLTDLQNRLDLISRLPNCNWWVLELREEAALFSTLQMVEEFLMAQSK